MRSKNGERRTIPVNETVLSILRQKNKVHSLQSDLVFCSKAFTPKGAICAARSGWHSPRPRSRIFISMICGIPSRRAWFKPGLIYKVQRLLGPKSPVMTQRYAHHYPESLRDGIDLLSRLAGQGTELVHPGQVSAVSGV